MQKGYILNMTKETAKKNFTIRLDTETREQLEFISEREFRTIANQMMLFIKQGINNYIAQNFKNPLDIALERFNRSHAKDKDASKNQDSSSELEDIPF